MARLYEDFIDGTLSASVTSGDTSLSSAEFADLPVVSGSDTLKLVLDPQGRENGPEVVTVTAHTSASTTVTVTRGEDGTTAVAHSAGAGVVLAVLASDVENLLSKGLLTAKGDIYVATGSGTVTRLAVGADDTVLTADAAEAAGIKWASAGGGTPQVDTFTASGTWTKPTGAVRVVAIIRSGGGGGGSGSGGMGGSGGGGGAGVVAEFIASDLGATEAVTVGSGGGVATQGGSSAFGGIALVGGDGGVTNSVQGYASGGHGAYGGTGGSENQPDAGNSVQGGGGGGRNSGGNGGKTVYGGGGGGGGGGGSNSSGGSSVLGGNGGAGSTTGNASNGSIPSGGGGGTDAGTGGSGARGEVIVTTYF